MTTQRQQPGCPDASGATRVWTAWLLALVISVAAFAAPPDDELPPVRRVLLRPEQLATELERVQRGVLRQLPRDEFEELIRRAAAAQDDVRNPPRLLETTYRAVLSEDALVGSAEWKVRHLGPRPALLSVEPLQIAVRSAGWADGPPALLGHLDNRPQAPGLELLIDRPGERTLTLAWSARGLAEPGGLRFDLRVPACPVATLELDLPADREPAVPREDGLLTGPLPAAAPDRRLWRLAFGPSTQIDLSIRSPGRPDQPGPLVLARQRNRQELTPGQVLCEYVFDLEVLHSGLRELAIECDPDLRPTEVSVRNLEHWDLLPDPDEDGPRTVRVRFREPFQGGPLTLRAVTAVTADSPWVSPAAHVVGAVLRGETLTLRVHPDLRLLDWRAGAFRLADATVTADRWHVLTLQTGLTRPAGGRPTARLQPAGPEYRVRERLWWLADTPRMTLAAHLSFDVTRGPVFQVPLRPPAGWTVERVEAEPADLLASWSVQPATAPGLRPTLQVDFQKPLLPGSAAQVHVLLRRRPPNRVAGSDESVTPFPDLVPLAARGREGILSVRVAPVFQASVNAPLTTSLPPVPSGEKEPAPWGDAPADYSFTFHTPAITGSLQLRSRAARLHARSTTAVTVTGRQAAVVHRLRLEPEAGAPDGFLLHLAAEPVDPWNWRVVQGTNRVRSAQRLDLGFVPWLTGTEPWSVLAAAGWPRPAGGSWWGVTLVRPLTEPVELEAASAWLLPTAVEDATTAAAPLAAADPLQALSLVAQTRLHANRPPWTVPLLTVPGADPQDHRLTLDLRAAPGWQAAARGLLEVPDRLSSPRQRTYSYGSARAALTLTPADSPTEDAAILDRARLTTYATDPGRFVHRLSFRLLGWTAARLPLDLPPAAVIRLARVNGADVRAEVQSAGGRLHAELPVPAGTGSFSVEVVYTTPATGGRLIARYAAEAPILPAAAGGLRHVWCLPEGTEPLAVDRWQRLPDAAASGGPAVAVPLAATTTDGARRWGEALSRWAAQADAGGTLVLDLWALDDAGVTPARPLPAGGGDRRPFWEAAGLVSISWGGGTLLTARGWSAGAAVLPPAWEEAVAQAAQVGFDASGRFRRAFDWAYDDSVGDGMGILVPPDLGTRGTFWESADPREDGSSVWAVRPHDAAVAGAMIALAALTLAWFGRGWSAQARWTGLLTWLGLAVMAAVWLPESLRDAARWPLWAALLTTGWALLPAWPAARAESVGPSRGPSSVRRVVTAGVALLVWFEAAGYPRSGSAAAPPPVIVYLVPGPPDAPEPRSVLVPPALLDQLQALARRGTAGLSGAVATEARYEGQVAGGLAQFKAFITAYSFTDEPAVLALPLGGIQLRAAALDGGAILPRAVGDLYQFTLHGRGSHTLELTFAVPCPGPGEDRELCFTVPEVPNSRLTLQAPTAATHLQTLVWRGAQRVVNGSQMEVDLGRVGAVHVRWRLESRTARPALPRVREAYLWDLTESAARLYGMVRFTVAPASVLSLAVDVPKGLEVAAVAVRPLDDPPPASAAASGAAVPWLKAWRLVPGESNSRLVLELSAPVTGQWQATMEFVPREPFAPTFALTFPAAVGTRAAPTALAWRAQGVEPVETRVTGVVPLAPDAFARDYGLQMRAGTDPRPPTRAYLRAPSGMPVVRLNLANVPRPTATDITWHVGPRRAEVEAAARISAGAAGKVALVEWDVPGGVSVYDVRGPDVATWTRTGGRLQVWLQRSVTETTVQWAGTIGRAAAATQFTLPAVRPRGATVTGTLRVAARFGWSLAPTDLQQLEAIEPTGLGGHEWAYRIVPPAYRATFQVRPAAGTTDFRVHTAATVEERRVVSTTTIDALVRDGELRSLTVTARRGAGWEFQVEAPDAVRVTEQPGEPAASGPASGARSWLIDLPPGRVGSYQLRMTARRPLDAADEVVLPDVGLALGDSRSGSVERVVTLAGPELRLREAVGLRPRPEGGWQVVADDWRLRLRAALPRSAGHVPARVELADAAVARADDGRWVRRVTFWLAHDSGRELRAVWAAPVRVLAVALDGRSLVTSADPTGCVLVPLPDAVGARALEVIWAPTDDDGLPPSGPDVPKLTLDGEAVPAGPLLWTAHALSGSPPPAAAGDSPAGAPLSPATAALYRAAAQVRLAGLLHDPQAVGSSPAMSEQATALRARAGFYLRQADVTRAGEPDADGANLTAWRQQLHDALGAAAGLRAPEPSGVLHPFEDAFTRGVPITWSIAPGANGPRLTWPAPAPTWPANLRRTALLALLGVFGVWWWRRVGAAGWPEQLIVVGLVGWTAGAGSVWLVPAATGVGARLFLLGRAALRRWWWTEDAGGSPTPNGPLPA